MPKLAWVATKIGGTGAAFKIRLHKAAFLLQALGFPTRYEFDLYIRGPYSSELEDNYKWLVETELIREYAKYADVDEKRWGPVVDKLAAEDALVLEVAATLYDLLSHGWSLEEAKERVMELKPYATRRLVEEGVRLLRELGLPGAARG